MESKRQNRINKLLQKDLGEILQLEGRNLFSGAMLTVTKVQVSPDLGLAKVYISIFASKDNEATLKKLRSHTKEIRHQLFRRINGVGSQVSHARALHDFVIDAEVAREFPAGLRQYKVRRIGHDFRLA